MFEGGGGAQNFLGGLPVVGGPGRDVPEIFLLHFWMFYGPSPEKILKFPQRKFFQRKFFVP